MSDRQPEPVQYEFDFGEKYRECVCASHVVAFAMARAAAIKIVQHQAAEIEAPHHAAVVLSMSESLARKQQARDDMLYESILARIKHLPF